MDTESLQNPDGASPKMALKIMDEVLSMDLTKMEAASTEDLVKRNANAKRKRRKKKIKKKANIKDETQSMDQANGILNLHLSDGNHGRKNDDKTIEMECTALESESESSLSDSVHDKENPLNLCSISLKGKLENEVNNEIIVYQGKCSTQVTTHLSPPTMKEAECLAKDIAQCPRAPLLVTIRRKLIVLDVNGLLANIVMPPPKHCRGDTHIYGRAIFKRPFCDDFLKFCFQNFDVAVWSSRSRGVIIRVVDYLLGDLKDKLLFIWDMDHSTKTGFKTLENYHKPLVCKELRRIWKNDDPNVPWKKGDYDESNTLLLDDSPYKALLNPLHTAIFPNSYHFEDKNDNSLGPGGDLRVYLEGLLSSENVQEYVEQHPFGQSAINETNLSWEFYSGVLHTMLNQMEANNPTSLPTLS